MVLTNFSKSGNTLLWCGSADVPRYCAIGSGSGTEVATLGSLVAEVLASRKDFTTRDISVANQMTWTYDFASTSMSGITLREFGVAGSQAKNSQTLWNREAVSATTFDGTNELQIQVTFRTTT